MKAVIQAGGKGTRVSSLTGDVIPKPMLEVGGYPMIYHQLMNLKKCGITDIILIVGHLGEVIKEYFQDGKALGLNITYYDENPKEPLGTAGALYHIKDQLDDDFIFLLADVFIDIDFNRMIGFHYEKAADVTLFTHPNSHPFDSDIIVCDEQDKVTKWDSKNNVRDYDYKNIINAGIMIFSKGTLDLLTEPKKYNYEKDIVVPLIEKGTVFSYLSTEYAKDMGTPERYERVCLDYTHGFCAKRNLANKQKAIFLDRDGTINEYVGFLRKKEDFALLPGASEAIKQINNSEYLCIVITNQPVIARGEVTVDQLGDIHKKMETLLGQDGAYIDGLYYCPHHPDKGFEGEVPELKFDCDCRKPKIGMLLQAAADFNIDLAQSIVIGDSTLDIKMAENAGIRSVLLNTGQRGLDGKFEVKPTDVAEDIYEAVNKVLKEQNLSRQ